MNVKDLASQIIRTQAKRNELGQFTSPEMRYVKIYKKPKKPRPLRKCDYQI